MRNLYLILMAVVCTALLLTAPVKAQNKCDPVDQESILIKGIAESPDLLMAEIDGAKLQSFWAKMRDRQMLIGEVQADKIYVFYSEHHPFWVYVYFLNDSCINNVTFTFKNLIEEFLQ